MAVLVLTGLLGLPSTPFALVALFEDILFTTAALFVPRLFVRSIRREDQSIRESSGLPNILVAGTGRDAVRLADDLMLTGSYNVIGFLSEDPAQTGMIIGNLTVYNATCAAEIEALQWRLGGIDAIFFPSGFCHPGKHKQAA